MKPNLPLTAHIIDPAARRAFAMHDRGWKENLYVYPVVSRRSKGISIGVNLNPDKICNFDCIYCSVNRSTAPTTRSVDLPRLRAELEALLNIVQTGEIYQYDPFDKIPTSLRRLNDIAFSGDGEPTSFAEFLPCCQMVGDVKKHPGLADLKIVLITNATLLHRENVRAGLRVLEENGGEIWGKLDAGTEAYYKLVDRSGVKLQRVLDNLLAAAREWGKAGRDEGTTVTGQERPGIVIQSLFLKIHGAPPPAEEIAAYADRLRYIIEHGGKIRLVQVYTVARDTTEAYATKLTAAELDGIAERIRAELQDVPVEVYA